MGIGAFPASVFYTLTARAEAWEKVTESSPPLEASLLPHLPTDPELQAVFPGTPARPALHTWMETEALCLFLRLGSTLDLGESGGLTGWLPVREEAAAPP